MEKEYTLKISKYINNRLKELGIDSALTRDSDVTLEPADRVQKALSLYGSGSDVILLSNHINAGGGDGQSVTNKCITIKAKLVYK